MALAYAFRMGEAVASRRARTIQLGIVEEQRSGNVRSTTGAKITGIVGRDGGYTAKVANAAVVVPTISSDTVTPHAESFQAVVWHLIASDPQLASATSSRSGSVERIAAIPLRTRS